MVSGSRKQVSILYRMLPQYRVDFFEQLRVALDAEGIDLQLVYGRSRNDIKKDEASLPWGTVIPHHEWKFLGVQFFYQRLPESIYNSSLIILMQENKILSNYVVKARARRRGIRIAFWGHGVNFQDKANSLSNWWKRKYSAQAEWWFAYTDKVARLVSAMGFPANRISVVNNAIDTKALMLTLAAVTDVEKQDLRATLKITPGPVGIYCGGMYPEKRLPFLFEACEKIRAAIPGFQLIMIGAGSDAGLAKDFAAERDWAHYLGPKFGMQRVVYFAISDIFLMPGLVGLAVLDSFALQTPIVTTTYPFHSPEIDYITDKRNGLITSEDVSDYAETVVHALTTPGTLAGLRENARRSAEEYTVEAMTANFTAGVLAAIQAPLAR